MNEARHREACLVARVNELSSDLEIANQTIAKLKGQESVVVDSIFDAVELSGNFEAFKRPPSPFPDETVHQFETHVSKPKKKKMSESKSDRTLRSRSQKK